MRLYECTFIIRQELPAQDVHKLIDRYRELAEEMNGKVIKKEYWGLRSLAYEIKKNRKGHYFFLGLNTSQKVIKKIEDNCRVSEDIIKFLTIKVRNINDRPTLMMQTPNEIK